MTRVLLVDDQPVIRNGLSRILGLRPEFEIVGECDDGDEVEAAVETLQPDVVVMDIRMKRVDGAEATRRLRLQADAPPVLVLTTYDDDETLSRSLRAGAAGFVLKDAPAEDLIRAVRTVAAGDAWLDPTVTQRVLSAFRAVPDSPSGRLRPELTLTARELEVLALVGRGLSNSELAESLHISEVTVSTHLGHILTKLDLRDRATAIVYAFDAGLVFPQ
jgi:DNA-binding NarL/FixJ family response regulator